MSFATDRGFEIGKLYRVIQDDEEGFYKKDSVVTFEHDDNSSCPLFTHYIGTKFREGNDSVYIYLDHLQPYELEYKNLTNKDLLVLHIQQHHPLDKMLIALVESL